MNMLDADEHQESERDSIAWRMPAEWEPHERCVIAWPVMGDLWGKHYGDACAEYAATIEAISAFEPVTVITSPGTSSSVRAAVPSVAEIVEMPIDDSWTRDSGPIITVDDAGHRRGVDFAFNGWGGRFPHELDDASAAKILEHLGIDRLSSPMVLEGGGIAVDGQGTLITTEQCLLNSNRNPSMTKEEIEAELGRTLGVTTVIWLPFGLRETSMTDGHVDGVLSYVRPGVVLAQTYADPEDPVTTRMAANLKVLRSATDARGRPLEVIEMPYLPYFEFGRERLSTFFANLYLPSGGVVVPVGEVTVDEPALEVVRHAFPERDVVAVVARTLAHGGGGVHCITQQVPLGRSGPLAFQPPRVLST
jgi:agmatine deiminase